MRTLVDLIPFVFVDLFYSFPRFIIASVTRSQGHMIARTGGFVTGETDATDFERKRSQESSKRLR